MAKKKPDPGSGVKDIRSFFAKKETPKKVAPPNNSSTSPAAAVAKRNTPSTASATSSNEENVPEQNNAQPQKQKWPNGTKVRKDFPGYGVFDGRLVSYNVESGFYEVQYDDNDEEELSETEFQAILLNDDGKKPDGAAVAKKPAGAAVAKKPDAVVAKKPAAKKRRVILEDSDEEFDDDDEEEEDEEDEFEEPNEQKPAASKKKAPTTAPKKRPQQPSSSSSRPKKAPKLAKGWSFMDGKGTPKTVKKPATASTAGRSSTKAYTGGDDLDVISEPQAMFNDMISSKLAAHSKHVESLKYLMKALNGRPLKVATMCSGTESPILALDMLMNSIEDFFHHESGGEKLDFDPVLRVKHVFSCEIEIFKQGYIERNFQPPLLFRDIRELGKDEAYTAYGSLAEVPNQPGCVDLLVAGTSCVDYSNLNTQKKEIEQQGESGQTWRGLIDWIKKAQPPLVILENVDGAPWTKKVEIFNMLGYHAHFIKCDTKHHYIPHTRKRGYLFAIKKCGAPSISSKTIKEWEDIVKDLKRPASAALDGFMFANDDPRVLRGRARLIGPEGSDEVANNRVDWGRCEVRHQKCRSEEDLGDRHCFTGWSESGLASTPSWCWTEWFNDQVPRILDLTDINTLRQAKEGIDPTFVCQVWNLSQNVDRDTMGRLGLCSCLTPSGVPYVTTRGGPLVGEELLFFQGIPADDLNLSRETEKQLKDLAGNAMSTTVVGACMLSALLVSHQALLANGKPKEESAANATVVESLVPRALQPPPADVTITRDMGTYASSALSLRPLKAVGALSLSELLKEGQSAATKCTTEGGDIALPCSELVQCRLCSHTTSTSCATPARKYEEHDFVAMTSDETRIDPAVFRSKLLKMLPMRLQIKGVDVDKLPDDVSEFCSSAGDKIVMEAWKDALLSTVYCESGPDSASTEYRFSRLNRGLIWTAFYYSPDGCRLELRLSDRSAVWLLFAKAPPERGPTRDALLRPLARMEINSVEGLAHAQGAWEVCLPFDLQIEMTLSGCGEMLMSWRARLGLQGPFSLETQPEAIQVEVKTPGYENIQALISGKYTLLPKCGGACGSLHKRERSGADCSDMFFYLDPERCSLADSACYVISPSKDRTGWNEYKEIIVRLDSKFRPEEGLTNQESITVKAHVPGKWVNMAGISLECVSTTEEPNLVVPSSGTLLKVSMGPDGWKQCPELLSCEIPVDSSGKLFLELEFKKRAGESQSVALNLRKSKKIFEELAFLTSRLEIPGQLSEAWMQMDADDIERDEGEEIASSHCFPPPPDLTWRLVKKGKTVKFEPIEDGRQAAAYEQSLKRRPNPWLLLLSKTKESSPLELHIGCNAASLAHRALGRLPGKTPARRTILNLDSVQPRQCLFDWRVVPHVDQDAISGSGHFPKLQLTSNKNDAPALQPPGFEELYPLRPEQRRSLAWMLGREASTDSYSEEEVCEEVLPHLNWRVEARARRPVLVRGGIVADEVGYGKTAITLALIRAAPTVNGPSLGPPDELKDKLFTTKATLVIVPGHLMSQWPREIKKFLGRKTRVVEIHNMNTLNKLTISDFMNCDIVVVNFTVLSGDNYFKRLARFSGVYDQGLDSKKAGSRHFDSLYNECLGGVKARATTIRNDIAKAFGEIEQAAESHDAGDDELRLDGKKAVYKNVSEEQTKKFNLKAEKTKKPSKSLAKTEVDPWNLKSKEVQKDYRKMKCPPLEIMHWERVVCDEFTYLQKSERLRVLTLFKGLHANYRWALSGTPPKENFDDVSSLAKLLGIHLGIDFPLPGATNNKRGGTKDKETSDSEKFTLSLETHSWQWHQRRLEVAQSFLDRFCRQNVAEIDEIPWEEHKLLLDLPPAERAIYTELDSHLKSLDMSGKKALKSKKSSTGDRDKRMQAMLEGSESAEEALLKRCSHFDFSGKSITSAFEMCENITELREQQKKDCESDLESLLAAAFRQRARIEEEQPGWTGTVQEGQGEVQDRLEVFVRDVKNKDSVNGGADDEVHERLKELLEKALAAASSVDDSLSDDKEYFPEMEHDLYTMKFQLREHMHKVRFAAKELCGRMRALRFFHCIRKFQMAEEKLSCPGFKSEHCLCSSKGEALPHDKVGAFSCCGHTGCINCLNYHADHEHCIDPTCKAAVKINHIATAAQLGTDKADSNVGRYGAKLSAVVKKIKQLVEAGDRVICFVQFEDLKMKVKEALEENKVLALTIKGTVQQKAAALDVMQKETPDKGDPSVLILTMDDESSAGINLTTCNHAVFVHPLLADTQQQYEAYETQSIGRIRRYGQTKTVHIWRYLVRDSIDTEIFQKRTGEDLEPSK